MPALGRQVPRQRRAEAEQRAPGESEGGAGRNHHDHGQDQNPAGAGRPQQPERERESGGQYVGKIVLIVERQGRGVRLPAEIPLESYQRARRARQRERPDHPGDDDRPSGDLGDDDEEQQKAGVADADVEAVRHGPGLERGHHGDAQQQQ